jgi:alcohol dehydrogenase class IV
MRPLTLLQPPRLDFGDGCAAHCAAFLAGRGARRALLVTDRHVNAHLEPLRESLQAAGVALTLAPFVPPEPGTVFFGEALQAARAAGVDSVLGVGGGSAMDVAKLLAALVASGQNVREVFGIGLLAGRALTLACLPTTAGTGSEVSPNAILLDETAQLKKGVISPHLVPDAAFVDPQLTWSVPPGVTAATGLDALTHCIEAYANVNAHPLVDVYALQGVRLISAHLARAVQDGRDAAARAALALGSLYGGMCLGPVNTAAVHALAYPLGGRYHVPHGVSNALLLPHVLRFNLPAAAERYADIAEALGVPRTGPALAVAERGVERLTELSRAVGVPQRLSLLNIPASDIPALARSAMEVTRLLKNNPRPVTEADAAAIYAAAA